MFLYLKIDAVFIKANIGQDEDFEAAKEKALKLGAKNVGQFYVTQIKTNLTKIKSFFKVCLLGHAQGVR